MALNTSFILVIFRLLWKERFYMAFFHIALVFDWAVSFSQKGRLSMRSSLDMSSLGLHLGISVILSGLVRSKSDISHI